MSYIINPYRFASVGSTCDYNTATGGTITTDGDYKVHTFTSSGTFEVTCVGGTESDIQYLVVAGGGGGGHGSSGTTRWHESAGGGAGGY